MNDLENAARPWLEPMIRGKSEEMSQEAQETVSRWTIKTSIMLQYAHSPPSPVSPERLQSIFNTIVPPSDTWVWLSAYSGRRWIVRFSHRTIGWGSAETFSEDTTSEHVTVCVGHLVFQTFVRPRGWDIALEAAPAMPLFTLRIWPSTPLIRTWPPTGSLDEDGLRAFHDRFT
jgi:hypothetical protein